MDIIYIRTSTEEQNPENQLSDIYKICNNKDCEIIRDQQSAWKDSVIREEFEKLLGLIRSHKVSNLYVWDLDRIYRNRKKLIDFFKFCQHYKCKVYSYRQSWLQDLNKIPKPFDEIMFDLMLQIMGWLAEEESAKKSERITASIRKRDGVTVSYKGNKWGRKSLSKKVIDQIIMLRKQGESMKSISNSVTYTDKNNKRKNVSMGAVHKILKENPL